MGISVIYGSKYGATAEIANAIAVELRSVGFEAAVHDADGLVDLPRSEVLIIGSAVYAGHWRKPVRRLIDALGPEIRSRRVWLFSSGPIGDTGPDGEPADLDELLEHTGARGHMVFAGNLDLGRLTLPERLMVKALKAPAGDFRDWGAIRRWARAIAIELEGSVVPTDADPEPGRMSAHSLDGTVSLPSESEEATDDH